VFQRFFGLRLRRAVFQKFWFLPMADQRKDKMNHGQPDGILNFKFEI
jgi:hypothetical protein